MAHCFALASDGFEQVGAVELGIPTRDLAIASGAVQGPPYAGAGTQPFRSQLIGEHTQWAAAVRMDPAAPFTGSRAAHVAGDSFVDHTRTIS